MSGHIPYPYGKLSRPWSLEDLAEVIRSGDAVSAGENITRFYQIAKKTSLHDLFTAMTESLCGADDPLFRAGKNLAAYMDWCNTCNEYHNSFHTRKVMINAFALACVAERKNVHGEYGEQFTPREKLELFFSALAHDLHHNGRDNGGELFLLEDASVNGAVPFMEKAGVDKNVQERIRFLVRWTDLNPNARQKLSGDANFDERTKNLGLVLSDADILASVALTAEQALEETINLGKEWEIAGKGKIGARGYIAFADFVLGKDERKMQSRPGRFFNPNISKVISGVFSKLKRMERLHKKSLFPLCRP